MPTLDLNDTFGALLIGVVLSAGLFGVTCSQVFYYSQNYASDGILIKGAVATLLILEGLHSAFSIHAIYYYTILNYLNPLALIQATWSAIMTLGISSLIILVVHLFYVRRVYHVSRKNIPLVTLLAALSLGHFGTGIAVTVRAFQLEFFAAFSRSSRIVAASLSLAVATDILTAASLSYYLHTSRSGIERTDTLINKLMAYAINNGILTSLFDIIVLTFDTVEPNNLIFLAIFQVVGNLYTNSMMATLNSRHSLSKVNPPAVSGSGYIMNSLKAAGSATAVPIDGPELSVDSKASMPTFLNNRRINIVEFSFSTDLLQPFPLRRS
ncbi:hypothetical protein GALMADRAFT_145313 [Galerina marginata CBS 339.88]|uniref:DUF6534 domain-containing protein n=1 Tax=Galerina marginata (strain CBS 339.88) TaxID=685588 RepID=A0A067SF86_GALM3|nr:hypothetical protein GALMADRAFT_145313 [Galerina marginata CBS 339.88]